ncbi:hypothetical protein ZWY2020_021952 [Hordeum vulgare]|nr:hypothetical protein ZWY2020_021952 [Hordeum vulgare]
MREAAKAAGEVEAEAGGGWGGPGGREAEGVGSGEGGQRGRGGGGRRTGRPRWAATEEVQAGGRRRRRMGRSRRAATAAVEEAAAGAAARQARRLGRLAAGISKFTGESKPEAWQDDYRVAVQIGGGNNNVAMKHLPLMLDGSARAWLNQLPPSSIYYWADLARVFIKTFDDTCKRPAHLSELHHCIQKPSESLRDYIQHWTTLHHTLENATEHQAVCAFKAGVRYRVLYLKFGRTGDMSMMEIATRYANVEEEDRLHSGKGKAVDGDANRKQKQKVERTPLAEAAAL